MEEWQGELQSPSMLARHSHWDQGHREARRSNHNCRLSREERIETFLVRKVVLATGEELTGG